MLQLRRLTGEMGRTNELSCLAVTWQSAVPYREERMNMDKRMGHSAGRLPTPAPACRRAPKIVVAIYSIRSVSRYHLLPHRGMYGRAKDHQMKFSLCFPRRTAREGLTHRCRCVTTAIRRAVRRLIWGSRADPRILKEMVGRV